MLKMNKNKILFFIELPKPVHGMTYINQIIYENLKNIPDYYFHRINYTQKLNEVGSKSLKKFMNNILVLIMAWKSLYKYKPDKVYSLLSASKFGIIRDFMINMPAILLNKELILHLHGFTYYQIYQLSKFYRVIFNILTKNATLIVLCEEQKMQTFKIMGKESVILHNCLKGRKVMEKKVKNQTLQICYISNISEQKGTFELIKAIQKSKRNIKLIIAGEFLSDKDDFFKLIENDENITYVGFANEEIKSKILMSSDIFCLPSKLEEGSPISIIEAMRYGLPVIGSNKGCIKEMILKAGYILPENYDNKDIISGIEFIEKNYYELSLNAQSEYLEHYSEEKFIYDLQKIL